MDNYKNEAEIVRDIINNLEQINALVPKHKGKIFAWKNNTGALNQEDPRRRHGVRLVRFGLKGSADIIGSYHGRFMAIECKFEKNKTTASQDEFLARIRQTGGLAFVARSFKEVEKELDL